MANNQYNFLDYAGLSLFWNNVKSIIEENELATASALTNLDTRVDNVESSKSDKGHTHTKSDITDFVHTHTKSQITDFPTSLPASDVYSWAKQSTKPSYSFSEITSKPTTISGYGITDALTTSNYTSYTVKKDGTGASGTWGINISGNAATAGSAQAANTAWELPAERFDSDDPTPNSKNGLTFQFSYNLGSGASGWWNVLNMRSYSDINYTSSQIITPADNPGTDTGYSGDMKWRQGRNSTWLDWKTLLDSNNYTTYCTPANIGAAPSSHTHNKSQITDFAHTHTKSQITDFAHTHTKSQITDFPTSLPASDVKAWAKADNKPSYTGTEVTLSGYSKNNSYTPIASGDSVQAAIAKLEGAINGLEDLLASI